MNPLFIVAWLTAIVATLGSLFFSEVMHFIPCTLCWYQRILMYPLTVFIGIAFYNKERTIYKYVLPLSITGMLVSGYHYGLQKIPFLQKIEMCTSGVPCSGHYINWLGFITIPFLAFCAFTIITITMLMLRKQSNEA